MFEIDTDWADATIRLPRKSGLYWVICGDGQQRKAQYHRRKKQPSLWHSENGFHVPDTWNGIQAWKPYDPRNPNDD